MRSQLLTLPLASAVLLAGCSSGTAGPVSPTASSAGPPSTASTATGAATATATATATVGTPSQSPSALSTPQAQASALAGGLASAGALDPQQRQQVQDQLATALASPGAQAKLQQACTALKTGLVDRSRVRSLVRDQLAGSGTTLDDAQVDAVISTLRTDVCSR